MKKYVLLSFLTFFFAFQTWAESDLESRFEPDVWEQINAKFLIDSVPIRYYSNILIRLDGKPTPDDQNIVKEYASMLDSLIDVWDVYVIEIGTANLVLEINSPTNRGKENQIEARNNSREIVESHVILNIPNNTSLQERKKILYYYLVRAMVDCSKNDGYSSYSRKRIPGAVFDEKKPENITFQPIDQKIIRALYSEEFEDSRKYVPQRTPLYKNVRPKTRFQYKVVAELVSILLAMIYLILASQAGIFKKHDYDFVKFFRQGLFVMLSYLIYFISKEILISLFTLQKFVIAIHLTLFMSTLVFTIVSIMLVYTFESVILSDASNSMRLRIIIPFLATTFIPSLIIVLLSLLSEHYLPNNIRVLDVGVHAVSFCLLIAVSRTFFIFMNQKAENAIKKKDVQLAQLNELHKQAQLQSLQSKINPHFLYNALNSIASLATSDGKRTEEMALALSDFFKYSLNKEQKEMVALKDEIESVETYLTIEKVRFGERLSSAIHLPKELENLLIPQFLIQPVVENAVKHGISKLTKDGRININITQENKQLQIQVFDNGPAFPDEPISGYGLQSIQEKLHLIYKGKAYFKWENEPRKCLVIFLPL